MSRTRFPWTFEEANLGFTKQQRDSLAQFGLHPEQLEILEQILPHCAFAVRKQPARTDVAGKFETLEKQMRRAREALQAFLTIESAATDEALLLTRLVDVSLLGVADSRGDEVLERAQSSIDLALKVVGVAQDLKRSDQQRHKRAMLFPIGQVDGALREGFRKHYELAGAAQPQYPLGISRYGRFRDVVEICYEAIGQPNADPDRAIRAYLESQKARGPHRRRARQRRKQSVAGRQVRKKS